MQKLAAFSLVGALAAVCFIGFVGPASGMFLLGILALGICSITFRVSLSTHRRQKRLHNEANEKFWRDHPAGTGAEQIAFVQDYIKSSETDATRVTLGFIAAIAAFIGFVYLMLR
jgi:hypothetical protein